MRNSNQLTLMVAVKDPLLREAICNHLRKQKNTTVYCDDYAKETLTEKAASLSPAVILLDISLVQPLIELTLSTLMNLLPAVKVIVLANEQTTGKELQQVFSVGIAGCLPVTATTADITVALQEVINNGYYISHYILAVLFKWMAPTFLKKEIPFFSPDFSITELNIIRLLCDEYTNKEIAHMLQLSIRTVEGYRTRIMNKLGVKTLAGIMLYAIRSGIYNVEENK